MSSGDSVQAETPNGCAVCGVEKRTHFFDVTHGHYVAPTDAQRKERMKARRGASTPKRIQRKRTKGWRMPDGAVYVGRPTMWGNPYEVVQCFNPAYGYGIYNRRTADEASAQRWPTRSEAVAHAVRRFREWMQTSTVAPDVADLTGRDLVCWCPLEDDRGNRLPCHADVLLELANPGLVIPTITERSPS